MKKLKVKLLDKVEKSKNVFLLTLESGGSTFKPGQFVNVSCAKNADFILRRPLSIFNAEKKYFGLLFEVKGKGTKALSQKEIGSLVDIVAPLGKGFSLNQKSLLIAGGMGIAPINYLANALKSSPILLGARTKDTLFDFGLPEGIQAFFATDDGSAGYKGLVTDLLAQKFDELKPEIIYACGPQPMVDEVIRFAKEKKVKAEASLERYMACGTGICLSCVCKTKSGYQRVCREGPVFSSKELDISRLEIEAWGLK